MAKIIDNFCICTQNLGGRTFEDEFLLENMKNHDVAETIFKKALSKTIAEYYNKYGFNIFSWIDHKVDEIKRRLDNFTDYIEVYTIHGFIIENIIKPFQDDLRTIMESDFGINVNNRGIISSQIEGLGILHGINKDDIYDFIKKTNPTEFANDDLYYSKKVMGEIEIDNSAFLTSLTNELPRQMKFKASQKVEKRHIIPLKKYIWSVVKKLTHNEILYFGYRLIFAIF